MEAFVKDPACPVDEIASYIDGELGPVRELEVEAHFAECTACADELNLQKQFLCGLEASLKRPDELALPRDFTKHIVANAESTVSGLRRPRERFNAVFICAGLMLFILFALGTDAGRLLGALSAAVDKVAAIGLFFVHLIYDLFIGITIVMRSFVGRVPGDVFAAVLLVIVVTALIAVVSQRVLRMRRA